MMTASSTNPMRVDTRSTTYAAEARTSNHHVQAAATRMGQVTASVALRRLSDNIGVVGRGGACGRGGSLLGPTWPPVTGSRLGDHGRPSQTTRRSSGTPTRHWVYPPGRRG